MQDGPGRVAVHLVRGFAALGVGYVLSLVLRLNVVASAGMVVPLAASVCLVGGIPGYAVGVVAGGLEPLWSAVIGVIGAMLVYTSAPNPGVATSHLHAAAFGVAPLAVLGGWLRLVQRRRLPGGSRMEAAGLMWEKRAFWSGVNLCILSYPIALLAAIVTTEWGVGWLFLVTLLIVGVLLLAGSCCGWPRHV